jgi:hypothetical protein
MSTDPLYDADAELAKGRLNAVKVMDEIVDVSAAFRHHRLGLITLLYGDQKLGVCHILDRRTQEISRDPALANQVPRDVVLKLIEVIIYGEGKRQAGPKWVFEHDGYRAILGCPDSNQLNYWLLSGYKIT